MFRACAIVHLASLGLVLIRSRILGSQGLDWACQPHSHWTNQIKTGGQNTPNAGSQTLPFSGQLDLAIGVGCQLSCILHAFAHWKLCHAVGCVHGHQMHGNCQQCTCMILVQSAWLCSSYACGSSLQGSPFHMNVPMCSTQFSRYLPGCVEC